MLQWYAVMYKSAVGSAASSNRIVSPHFVGFLAVCVHCEGCAIGSDRLKTLFGTDARRLEPKPDGSMY
jgi:elongation factor P--beta-lysine ligase